MIGASPNTVDSGYQAHALVGTIAKIYALWLWLVNPNLQFLGESLVIGASPNSEPHLRLGPPYMFI